MVTKEKKTFRITCPHAFLTESSSMIRKILLAFQGGRQVVSVQVVGFPSHVLNPLLVQYIHNSTVKYGIGALFEPLGEKVEDRALWVAPDANVVIPKNMETTAKREMHSVWGMDYKADYPVEKAKKTLVAHPKEEVFFTASFNRILLEALASVDDTPVIRRKHYDRQPAEMVSSMAGHPQKYGTPKIRVVHDDEKDLPPLFPPDFTAPHWALWMTVNKKIEAYCGNKGKLTEKLINRIADDLMIFPLADVTKFGGLAKGGKTYDSIISAANDFFNLSLCVDTLVWDSPSKQLNSYSRHKMRIVTDLIVGGTTVCFYLNKRFLAHMTSVKYQALFNKTTDVMHQIEASIGSRLWLYSLHVQCQMVQTRKSAHRYSIADETLYDNVMGRYPKYPKWVELPFWERQNERKVMLQIPKAMKRFKREVICKKMKGGRLLIEETGTVNTPAPPPAPEVAGPMVES